MVETLKGIFGHFLLFSSLFGSALAMNVVQIENSTQGSVLKKSASNVEFPLSNTDKQLIEKMLVKVQELGGVGLAAPQVNLSKRIITVYIPESASLLRDGVKQYPAHALVNPTYKPIDEAGMSADYEACYSVASKAGKVRRYNKISLEYQDEYGKKHISVESGFYARVLQHEIDHLNGLLITDRLTGDDTQGTVAEMMKLRRDELPQDKQVLFDNLIKEKQTARRSS